MRARLAIASSGTPVAIREVVLRDKPAAFLATSPSATVPCLEKTDGSVIDESLDVMIWALELNDPEGLLTRPDEADALISEADGPFKDALDRTKYASRFPQHNAEVERQRAIAFIKELDRRLSGQDWLFGSRPCLADFAILPFVRQFAMIDKPRFDQDAGEDIRAWLDRFLASSRLGGIMAKYPAWQPGDAETQFPSVPE